MDTLKEMQRLVDSLNTFTYYYDKGEPKISDAQWDEMYFALAKMEKESGITLGDSPTQRIPFQQVSELKKVRHNHAMLSLNKTKSIHELEDFMKDEPCVAMCKMDGLTCSLLYQHGKLVRAETRGDGQVGEDVTHNAIHIPSIPKTVAYPHDLVIDGEIICTYNDFKSFENEYKNPRNFAAGSIRLLDSKESSSRNLTFVAWDCITELDGCQTLTSKLEVIRLMGFTLVPWCSGEPNDCIDILKEDAEKFGYPIDGVVFKYNNCKYYKALGETAHHARGGIAYKFYDEAVETTLRDIVYEVSRRGEMTPVAVFDPVEIEGTIVNRCSLHNLSVIENLSGGFEWYRGDKLWITKRNQIIPNCERWEHLETQNIVSENRIYLPSICPYCGQRTSIQTSDTGVKSLFCSNKDCGSRFINRIDHYASKKGMDIKGLSKATLEKLIDWGWIEKIEDIYSLEKYRSEWIKKSGFGVASVDKILQVIENSKSCELSRFIAVLGIPLVGSSAAKEIEKNFKTWEKFREAIDNNYHFSQIAGFGWEMEKALLQFSYDEADALAAHLTFTNKNDNIITENKNNPSLEGKVFCITGKLILYKNRAELVSTIEAAGGKVTSSVTSKTVCLINNDTSSNTAKNKTAKLLNVPIVSEQDFLKKYLKQ